MKIKRIEHVGVVVWDVERKAAIKALEDVGRAAAKQL